MLPNRFSDGEDAYHNKRARSPKDNRPHQAYSQRRRSHNYDNHNQIAVGFKGKSSEEEDHRNVGYRNRDDPGATNSSSPETT
jgi:hypothetical protein